LAKIQGSKCAAVWHTADKKGQMLIIPEVEVEAWWTTLHIPKEQVCPKSAKIDNEFSKNIKTAAFPPKFKRKAPSRHKKSTFEVQKRKMNAIHLSLTDSGNCKYINESNY